MPDQPVELPQTHAEIENDRRAAREAKRAESFAVAAADLEDERVEAEQARDEFLALQQAERDAARALNEERVAAREAHREESRARMLAAPGGRDEATAPVPPDELSDEPADQATTNTRARRGKPKE